jgi:hypothetical protein
MDAVLEYTQVGTGGLMDYPYLELIERDVTHPPLPVSFANALDTLEV